MSGCSSSLVGRLADDESGRNARVSGEVAARQPFRSARSRAPAARSVASGRIREAEEHLASTIQLFETEGLDWLPIRACWHAARAQVPNVESTARESSNRLNRQRPAAQRFASCLLSIGRLPVARAGALPDGLTEDLITRLAKLRALFVIARGSVFALRDRNIPPQEAGRLLNVDYVVSGSVQQGGGRDCRDGRARRHESLPRSSGRTSSPASPTMRGACLMRSAIESSRRSPKRSKLQSAIARFSSRRMPRCLGGLPSRAVAHVPFQQR